MLFMMLLSCTMATATVSSAAQDKKEVDVKQIIFDHVKDSYEWHITTLGDKHVTIPLPIILYSSRTGWEVFSSSVFHEQEEYKGFRIARSGNNEGKIVEVDADGNERNDWHKIVYNGRELYVTADSFEVLTYEVK